MTFQYLSVTLLSALLILVSVTVHGQVTTTERSIETTAQQLPVDQLVRTCTSDDLNDRCVISTQIGELHPNRTSYVTWTCTSPGDDPSFADLQCVFSEENVVHRLIIRNVSIRMAALMPFARLKGLERLSLLNIVNKVSIQNVLLLFPHIEHLDVNGTEVEMIARSTSKTRIKTIDGLTVRQGFPPLAIMHLTDLRHLSVEMSFVDARFLFGLKLLSLSLTMTSVSRFDWNMTRCDKYMLRKLILELPNVNLYPLRIPFPNLRILSVRTRGVPFRAEFMTNMDNNAPLRGLQQVRFQGFAVDKVVFLKDIPMETLVLRDFTGDMRFIRSYPSHLIELTIQGTTLISAWYRLFGYLGELKYLNLAHNQIKYLAHDSFSSYPQLVHLNLADNLLTAFRMTTAFNKKLRTLDLSDNQIALFEPQLLTLPDLRILNVNTNQIMGLARTIPDGSITHALEFLDLRSNPMDCDCSWSVLVVALPKNTHLSGICFEGNRSVQLSQIGARFCTPLQFQRSSRAISPNTFDSYGRPFMQNIEVLPNSTDADVIESLRSLDRMKLKSNLPNILKPNLGMAFTRVSYLFTGVEAFHIHVHLLWPKFELPKFKWDIATFERLCRGRDSLIVSICDDFLPLVHDAVIRIDHYSKALEWKLGQIQDLFGHDLRAGVNAPRFQRSVNTNRPSFASRFSNTSEALLKDENTVYNVTIDDSTWEKEHDEIIASSALLPGVGGIMSNEYHTRRERSFKRAIDSLTGRQVLVKEAVVEIREDMVLAVNLIADTFVNTSLNIRMIHSLLNETNQQVLRNFQVLETSINILQQKIYAVRILSILTTRYLQLWSQQVHHYRILNDEADRLFEALNLLAAGKLSPLLIAPTQIRKLMAQASVTLESWHNDYTLVYATLSQIYQYSNVVFLPTKRGFMLQMLWPIRAKNSKRYDLFRAASVHVPVTTTPSFAKPEANHDFSKIRISKPYLGVSSTNFVELTNEQLHSCFRVEESYLCFDTILELDNAGLTCLTAIYANASLAEINRLCTVDYFFEPFRPGPTTLDSGSQVLISGLAIPWDYQCISDRIPQRVSGSLFAVIDRNSLCYCSISASNGYIPRKITDCTGEGITPQPSLQVTYVLNSLVLENLHQELNFSDFQTFASIPENFSLPKFTIADKVSSARLFNISQGSIKLKALAETIKQKGEDFLSQWDDLSYGLEFASWFTKRHIMKGITFCGAIAGYLALLMGAILYIRGQYQQGFLRSLMFASTPHLARAASLTEVCKDKDLTVALEPYSMLSLSISHMAIILLVMLIAFALKHGISYCCREARIMVAHPELRKHPKVELFLELHKGTERILAYLMTIRAHISKLHLEGQLAPSSLTLDHHRFYSVLRPNWWENQCVMKIDDIEIELPTIVQVPWFKRNKIETLMNGQFSCSIIACDGLYLYKLSDRNHKVISNQQINPYSALIAELRTKESEFQSYPAGRSRIRQSVHVNDSTEPSAPNEYAGNPRVNNLASHSTREVVV